MAKQLIKSSPFFGLSEIHRALDHLFDRNYLLENHFPSAELTQWTPKIDIKEKDNQYIIRADIPGVDPKDIDVSLEQGILTIKGKKEIEKHEEKENYMHTERASGFFYRAISLPNISDPSKIKAKSKNGVLEITVSKNEKTQQRKIQVQQE